MPFGTLHPHRAFDLGYPTDVGHRGHLTGRRLDSDDEVLAPDVRPHHPVDAFQLIELINRTPRRTHGLRTEPDLVGAPARTMQTTQALVMCGEGDGRCPPSATWPTASTPTSR